MKTLLLLLSLLVHTYSQSCFGVQSSNVSVCSGAGACLATDSCSCYSGYNGQNCGNVAGPTCTWNNVTQSTTGFAPYVDTTTIKFQNNNLMYDILSPLVNQRRNFTIYVQSRQYQECYYPFGNYSSNILVATLPCNNKFNFTIPWGRAVNCGWNITNGVDDLKYSGNIFVDATEDLGQLRGFPIKRLITSVVPIDVIFKKRLFMSIFSKIFSTAALYSAIGKQLYLPGPPPAGYFEIITSLQYPFILNTAVSFNFTSFPAGLSPSIVDISNPSDCVANQPCTQKFGMNVLISSACSFTGNYFISYTLACHSSVAPVNCSVDTTNNNVLVQVGVSSENFCVKTQVNIELTGSLSSYSDVSLSVVKNTYIIGQMAYFQAQLTSVKAVLSGTKLVRVQWEGATSNKVLYDNFATTADGVTEQFGLLTNTSSTAAFQFRLDSAWMPIPVDSNLVFNISALVEVTYSTALGDFTKSFEFKYIKDIKQNVNPLYNQDSQQKKQDVSIQIYRASVVNSASCIEIGALLLFAVFLCL